MPGTDPGASWIVGRVSTDQARRSLRNNECCWVSSGAGRGVAVRRGDVGVRGPRGGRGAGALRAGGGGGRGRARAAPRGRAGLRRRARPPPALRRLRLPRVPGTVTPNTHF